MPVVYLALGLIGWFVLMTLLVLLGHRHVTVERQRRHRLREAQWRAGDRRRR